LQNRPIWGKGKIWRRVRREDSMENGDRGRGLGENSYGEWIE